MTRGRGGEPVTCDIWLHGRAADLKPANVHFEDESADSDIPVLHLEARPDEATADLRRASKEEWHILVTGANLTQQWRGLRDGVSAWRFAEPLRAFIELAEQVGTEAPRPDGSDLLAYVASLQGRYPERWERALAAVRQIVPETQFDHLLLPLRPRERIAALAVREAGIGQVSWKHVAAGVKQTLFLTSLIVGAPDEAVVTVEEPECNLHPVAQRRLMEFAAREARDHNKQVIFSTHSLDMIESPGWQAAYLFAREPQAIEPLPARDVKKVINKWWDVRRFFDTKPGECILLLEGPDDCAVWEAWLRAVGLDHGVRVYRRGGGGALAAAKNLKDFARLGVAPPIPFVLVLDRSLVDGPDPGAWLDADEYYECQESDITAYLVKDPAALAACFNVQIEEVQQALAATVDAPPKERWRALARMVHAGDAAAVKGLVAARMAQIPAELEAEVVGRLRRAIAAVDEATA